MKTYYSKFRIMLITFAFGLASVFMLNGSLRSSDEMPVNLPKVRSGIKEADKILEFTKISDGKNKIVKVILETNNKSK